MLPDRVSNSGPLTYESGALPIALRGPAVKTSDVCISLQCSTRLLIKHCAQEFPVHRTNVQGYIFLIVLFFFYLFMLLTKRMKIYP